MISRTIDTTFSTLEEEMSAFNDIETVDFALNRFLEFKNMHQDTDDETVIKMFNETIKRHDELTRTLQ
jgi:hypothetical protein